MTRTALQLVAAAVEAAGREGITSEAACRAAGVGYGYGRQALSAAGKLGLVVHVRGGPQPLWFLPQFEQEARAYILAAADAKRRARLRARSMVRRHGPAAVGPALADEVVHRVAPASAPLPFACRAVASVFHLGAGAAP